MCQRAIYPGTFDPVTNGHIDVIKRAVKLFSEVIVAVAPNLEKAPLFTVEERVSLLKESLADIEGVTVASFKGLVVDFARKNKINIVIRGLRMLSDFEYEFQMALTNRKFDDSIETVFLMPSESYSYVSSKLLKEAATLGADVSYFLPPSVESALKKKLGIK
ncbi:MAG: pantetheine-phosphate adenylyltransferase [Candidatus Omnitrophica bacterium CG1_02_44_16]|nr:MAG: pantetheine-phosphate adenylyltransferase [Candidatus Omnitrophica bacterium CG1_02_44_16]PIY82091.1 MAG: pantetheine-phosphate adenylyltransferase [Candidatus Omnitrophica bacterium CG_4_10_14_0_8_um_filter_44_12]PIZ83279.1 MAG: pantetheine-phosphate adenylyltransferase [Candidatus Omnitrophica bacterium CG_4_10_14_0_2_um_filter_44_9]